ncbi:hypothetical protein [Sandaracinus amylolyticus]|uniref:Uncharacterized protein n=1 Tax=Sandaracinus amylolyticus TaxID=927083 RepID=A0A0F6W2U4_9BACT|nr:hypothetical protein [Sandaracinus amylolyticus]AKF05865.1 hypothetical protein DB32_003014 [Sandaracinus amylolyticus]
MRDGHRRAVEELERGDDYLATRAAYARIPGGVYLRPTERGLVVLALDGSCASMIGVGGRDRDDHVVARLPPSTAHVERALAGYEAKRATLARPSIEERHALALIAGALAGDLSLPWPGVFFVHQEWRFADRTKIDLLAVDPSRGRWTVIELKKSEAAARANDPRKGGDAWAQARAYAQRLHAERAELYPFFERIARALARHHGAPSAMCELRVDAEHVPDVLVAWP